MSKTTPIRSTDPATIYGINNLLIEGRLIVRDDLRSIRYTVFETEHPDATLQTPVPNFTDMEVSVENNFRDTVETITVFVDIGGAGTFPREVQYNFAVTIGPFVKIIGGERTVVYPFATRGRFYRVVVTFEFNDPTIAPFTHTEVIQSV